MNRIFAYCTKRMFVTEFRRDSRENLVKIYYISHNEYSATGIELLKSVCMYYRQLVQVRF